MPPDPPSARDEEILEAVRALQGGAGRDAFEVIFRRCYRPLFTFFANRPALREEAEDLAQATLFRAYERIHQYRCEASFQAWLWQIAENLWKNAVRELQAVKRPLLVSAPEVAADPEEEAAAPSPLENGLRDEAPNPEEEVLAGERTRRLQAAIEALPPGMRQCTELRLFADLRYREISDVTGIGLNSVRSQLFEARKRLKPVLDEYFQGAEL
ncbi:MAG TPA: sigma-70 family RNA polymerase sigma factor [Thermoanaerobaculia bacterium]|jgi:RNA polymerase sigma-70 factor (ECF subfamily)|nr:sigma-70 family RNA polymerase sigma factor [Thermoanaerobaculia bacterium]